MEANNCKAGTHRYPQKSGNDTCAAKRKRGKEVVHGEIKQKAKSRKPALSIDTVPEKMTQVLMPIDSLRSKENSDTMSNTDSVSTTDSFTNKEQSTTISQHFVNQSADSSDPYDHTAAGTTQASDQWSDSHLGQIACLVTGSNENVGFLGSDDDFMRNLARSAWGSDH